MNKIEGTKQRYDLKNPPLSFRLSRELKETLANQAKAQGISIAALIKQRLTDQETRWNQVYQQGFKAGHLSGYRKGYDEGYEKGSQDIGMKAYRRGFENTVKKIAEIPVPIECPHCRIVTSKTIDYTDFIVFKEQR